MLAAVLSLVSLLLTDQVIPWAMTNIENRVAKMMEKIFLDLLRTRNYYAQQDPTLTIEVLDVQGNKLIHPVIRYTPRGGSAMTLMADEASINFDLEKRVVKVKFLNGNVEIPNRQNMRSAQFEHPFPLPAESEKFKARNRTIHELHTKLAGLVTNMDARRNERDLETAFALASGDFNRLDQPDVLQYEIAVINGKEDIDRAYTDIHSRFAPLGELFLFCAVRCALLDPASAATGVDQLFYLLPADPHRLLSGRAVDDEPVEKQSGESGLGDVDRKRGIARRRLVRSGAHAQALTGKHWTDESEAPAEPGEHSEAPAEPGEHSEAPAEQTRAQNPQPRFGAGSRRSAADPDPTSAREYPADKWSCL